MLLLYQQPVSQHILSSSCYDWEEAGRDHKGEDGDFQHDCRKHSPWTFQKTNHSEATKAPRLSAHYPPSSSLLFFSPLLSSPLLFSSPLLSSPSSSPWLIPPTSLFLPPYLEHLAMAPKR
eukprot:59078-Hanusia_phi.AAC.2